MMIRKRQKSLVRNTKGKIILEPGPVEDSMRVRMYPESSCRLYSFGFG